MPINSVLKVRNDAELLSYIINADPVLREEIDLPVQGESIAPIGKIIVNNERYKNAFINMVNVIGLTLIHRNYWEDPWENFTNNHVMNFGDSMREVAVDIADVFDYNKYKDDAGNFLKTVVPNVYEYIHTINYQKFYKTTTADTEIAMAFNTEGGLMTLIDEVISSLWEGYKYDKYIVNKYMLCRRIVDGTITSKQITNYSTLTTRQRVAFIKNISSLMTFRNPNYNPAGLRIATPFRNQITILNTDFESDMTTDVLATSYFRNEAEMKSRLALIDGYGNHDVARLMEVLENQFIPFTSEEITALNNVPACIIDDEFFQNTTYALDNSADTTSEEVMTDSNMRGAKQTSFYNPETMKNNHWLHYWGIKATSPFKQACVFTTDAIGVESVSVSPSVASINQGAQLQMYADVEVTGFANKSVIWSVDSASQNAGVVITAGGLLKVPVSASISEITVTATSVYDSTKTATATITVSGLVIAVSTSNDLLGKTASDLQSNLSIKNNVVSGVSKYVTGYTGFSDLPAEQEGNYIALHLSATSGDITIRTVGGLNDGRVVTIASTGDDLVTKVVSTNEKLFITNGNITREIKLSGLTLESES